MLQLHMMAWLCCCSSCSAGSEDGPCVGTGPPAPGALAAVVVITFDRHAPPAAACLCLLPAYAVVACWSPSGHGAPSSHCLCAAPPRSLRFLLPAVAGPSTWSKCWRVFWQCMGATAAIGVRLRALHRTVIASFRPHAQLHMHFGAAFSPSAAGDAAQLKTFDVATSALFAGTSSLCMSARTSMPAGCRMWWRK